MNDRPIDEDCWENGKSEVGLYNAREKYIKNTNRIQ